MHVIAAKAVSFGEALKPEFKRYARAVVENAAWLRRRCSPPSRHRLGGNDTHLMLADLGGPKKVTGRAAEKALDRANITCNKNAIPFDTEKPRDHVRIRLAHGRHDARFRRRRIQDIGRMIREVIDGLSAKGEDGDPAVEESVKKRVIALPPLSDYPMS